MREGNVSLLTLIYFFFFPCCHFSGLPVPKKSPKSVSTFFFSTYYFCLSVCFEGGRGEFGWFSLRALIALSCLSVAAVITLHSLCCMGR